MPDLAFFYSANDPSVARKALHLGNHLLVGDDYEPDQELVLLSPELSADLRLYRRFYVLPDPAFLSEIELSDVLVKTHTGRKFRYIPDRIGAAAIDLILHDRPSAGEVCVGSLGFHYRTYPLSRGPLEVRPKIFHDAFNKLASFIKRSARRVPNMGVPKHVYVFPEAMALLREDFFALAVAIGRNPGRMREKVAMLKLTARIEIPHGVLFIYDPTMDIDVPDDTSAGPILHTGNCLTVWTIMDDEGQVSLTLAGDESDVRETKVFDGMLETEGRRLALLNSGTNPVLECEVPGARTRIAVYANHEFYPDEVICLVRGAV